MVGILRKGPKWVWSVCIVIAVCGVVAVGILFAMKPSARTKEVSVHAVSMKASDYWDENRMRLLFADKERILLYGYYGEERFGLFFFDRKTQNVVEAADLAVLGLSENEAYDELDILASADGKQVYIHNPKKESNRMYIWEADSGQMRVGDFSLSKSMLHEDATMKLLKNPEVIENYNLFTGQFDVWKDGADTYITELRAGSSVGEVCVVDINIGQEDEGESVPVFASFVK
ncbi:MAG: hypothetical protein E7277_06250 [Lachnospiraceae bacterium]|nr:hypothetical protein [Lachnospiraceae bacterium]